MHPEVVKEKHTHAQRGLEKGGGAGGGGIDGVLILIFMQTPNWPQPHSFISLFSCCFLLKCGLKEVYRGLCVLHDNRCMRYERIVSCCM